MLLGFRGENRFLKLGISVPVCSLILQDTCTIIKLFLLINVVVHARDQRT